MYADDTNMTFTACSIPELQHDMNIDLQFLQNWLIANRLTLNVLETEFMLVGSRQRVATLTQELDLSINGILLKRVNSSKCLGVEIDAFLTWDAHISSVSKKVSSGIGVIKKIKPFVPTSNLLSVYQSIVEPYLDYCSVVWDDISDQLTDKLQKLQNCAAHVITGADYRTPSSVLLNKLGWSSLKEKKGKVKSAFGPSGPSGRSLSRFPQHEATESISTPPWMGCQSIAGLPPSIKFAGTHLYTWVERGTVRVKCLAQEHNTMSPARARTRSTRSGVERANHEATVPPKKEKRNKQKALMMFKIMNGMTPAYLEDIFTRNIGRSVYNLRISRRNPALTTVKTDYYRNSFAYTGAKIWNALPDEMKYEKSMRTFKRKLESLNLSIDFQ